MGGVLHSPTTPTLRGASWSTLVFTTTSLDSCFKFSFFALPLDKLTSEMFSNFTGLFEIFMAKKFILPCTSVFGIACLISKFSPTMISDHVEAIGPFVWVRQVFQIFSN